MNLWSVTLTEPGKDAGRRSPSNASRALFAFCSFASAYLLFQVQLIVSKRILPWFGGTAAVWTTALLVFQVLLLAGYLYSHLLVLRNPPRRQVQIHIGLICTGLLAVIALSIAWPSAVTPEAAWKSVSSEHPVLGVAYSILVSAGLPFFILSTTAPLLQSWFARLGGGSESYRLYAISNGGSLLALVSYPVVIEPTLRIARQGQIWAALFCGFALSGIACAGQIARAGNGIDEGQAEPREAEESPHGATWWIRTLWFLLPACGSALLLSSTNKLCQEIASVPLLWVVPLILYLLSYIICFDHPRWYRRAIIHPAFAISLLAVCSSRASNSSMSLVGLPVLLFTGCMICHGELHRLKPSADSLTLFYLAISAGGAAGGVFVAVISPMVFTLFTEFQLTIGLVGVLMLAALAADGRSWFYNPAIWLPLSIAAGTVVMVFANERLSPGFTEFISGMHFYAVALALVAIAAMSTMALKKLGVAERSPVHLMHLALACEVVFFCFVLYESARPRDGMVLSRRNFYGVIQVIRWPSSLQLIHGATVHGEQLDYPFDSYPTTYYSRGSGIGILLENHPKRSLGDGTLRIGVVGLGAGTLAAYGRTGDSIRFYEIDPNVISLSEGANPTFTFLRNSPAQISLVQGDARLMLEKEEPSERSKYDVLVLDAFSGDAVPTHLLTREAFVMYLEKVDREDGVIAVHISSKHINLLPVLQGVSHYFGLHLLNAVNGSNYETGPVSTSDWVLLSRRDILRRIPGMSRLEVKPIDDTPPVLWTDDYSSVFRLLRMHLKLRASAN